MKINSATSTIEVEEEYDGEYSIEDLAEELPPCQPRFVIFLYIYLQTSFYLIKPRKKYNSIKIEINTIFM